MRGGKENQQRYHLENIENHRMINRRRKYRIKNLPSTFTLEQWEGCKKHFNNKCAYCGELADVLHQEHFIPVSSGGAYVIENIVPACSKCNLSKNKYDFFDWYYKQVFYSKSKEQKILQYLSDVRMDADAK